MARTFREQRPEISKISVDFPNFPKFSNVFDELQKQLYSSEHWIHERVRDNVARHNASVGDGDEDFVREDLDMEQVTSEFDRMEMPPSRMMPVDGTEKPEDVPVSAVFDAEREF